MRSQQTNARRPLSLAKPDFDEREVEAARRVLQSGWVVQGPEVAAFENAIAGMHGARHCIAVSSGTAALHVTYLALGIGTGDAVFVPGYAWPSAANVAVATGARPVFADVLPESYNIDPDDLRVQIERCVRHGWAKPRAVVPVHQFGLAADMAGVLSTAGEYDLDVIEDGACAIGSTWQSQPVGTLGKMGIFSFHPRKSITTGEGGAIVTNDDELAKRCRVWRNQGQDLVDAKRDFVAAGLNYRMTEIQAAIGSVQLAKFPEIVAKRRELATHYFGQLEGQSRVALPQARQEHTWQTLMVVLDDSLDRGRIVDRLAAEGIEVGPGSFAGHCATVYREQFGYRPGDLPCSARLDRSGLALPLHSLMSRDHVDDCVSLLCTALADDQHVGQRPKVAS